VEAAESQLRESTEQLMDVQEQLRLANQQLVMVNLEARRAAEEAEAARANAEAQANELHAILDNLGEGVVVLDRDAQLILRNSASRAIMGVDDGELQGLIERARHIRNPLLESILAGRSFSNERLAWRRPDGSERQLLVGGSSIRDDDGRMEMSIQVMSDVTEQVQAERLREEFVATISHDLRAPLAAIQGSAQLIQRIPDRVDHVRERAGVINENAKRMNAMIQDLVDSTRLESGQVRLDRVPMDVATAVQQLLNELSGALPVERIRVEVNEALPPALADRAHLARILTNLLTNALKYSPEGSRVTVSAESRNGEVTVSVIDQGQGISPEEQAKLFQKYQRPKKSRREGLGLGLYITRMLVEAHGGRIWVESQPGKGCAFSFTLPVMGDESRPED
jgi:two-component system, NtrC family, sensor histidine kinase KinB